MHRSGASNVRVCRNALSPAFSGAKIWCSERPASCAASWTGVGWILLPRPRGLAGWETTAMMSKVDEGALAAATSSLRTSAAICFCFNWNGK